MPVPAKHFVEIETMRLTDSEQDRRALWPLALYCLLFAAAVLLPIAVWRSDLSVVSNTYGKDQELFELFGLTASCALLIVGWIELRQWQKRTFFEMLPTLLSLFVGFHYLIYIVEYSVKSWDYNCYESAARSLVEGDNAYLDTADKCYLYPPLLAQGMTMVQRVISLTARLPESNSASWHLTFYLYQCAQYLALLVANAVCTRFAQSLGLSAHFASLMVAAILLLDNPLVRTLRHNQVNLWMLDLILLAILVLPKRPTIAGFLIAVGTHLKLFSLVLLPIWLTFKKWRAVSGIVIGLLFLLMLETELGHDFAPWEQYFSFSLGQSLERFMRFRNNSLQSLVYSTLRILQGTSSTSFHGTATVIGTAGTLVALLWMAYRAFLRERAYAIRSAGRDRCILAQLDYYRLVGHALDALALVLIVSPISWEHHYVIAIPIVIWASTVRGRSSPSLVGAGALLIFAVPTFDVFPLSFHRMIGLLLLLVAARPSLIPPESDM